MTDQTMHVRIVPMTADHLDEVAELERICFSTPWSRNMLAEELDNALSAFWWLWMMQAALSAMRDFRWCWMKAILPMLPCGRSAARKGIARKAAAGLSGLCPGQPAGVFDAGGSGVQL